MILRIALSEQRELNVARRAKGWEWRLVFECVGLASRTASMIAAAAWSPRPPGAPLRPSVSALACESLSNSRNYNSPKMCFLGGEGSSCIFLRIFPPKMLITMNSRSATTKEPTGLRLVGHRRGPLQAAGLRRRHAPLSSQ